MWIKIFTVTSLILSFNILPAQAALIAGTSSGINVVYDDDTNITWTSDANLLNTMQTNRGYDFVINEIIAKSPVVNSLPNQFDSPPWSGSHTVYFGDFAPGGNVSWFGAQAFVNYLNTVNYAGSSQWILPITISSDGTYQFRNDYYQTDSYLGQLYYDELHLSAGSVFGTGGIFGNGILSDGQQRDIEPFVNVQAKAYWSTETTWSDVSWYLNTVDGGQRDTYKNISELYVWAVSPGNLLVTVPLPSSIWLFGFGIIVLYRLKHHNNIF